MKLKGISPLERNVDRIVLGVTSVALLGAVGLQFLGSGNTIKVGTDQVLPAQAYDPVVREAKRLSDTLDRTDLKTPEVPAFTLSNKLSIGAATPRVAKAAGPSLGTAPKIATKVNLPTISDIFAAFIVPPPTGAVAYMFESTISPVEVLNPKNVGLEKLVSADQPFDKAAVSIEATFPGAALREALAKDPDGDGPAQPMPNSWWRDQNGAQPLDLVEVIAVEVERETVRLPNGTNPPSPVVAKLRPPPGRMDMRAMWESGEESVRSLGDMPAMVERARQSADEVQRPKYYDTIAGPEWKEPADAILAGDKNSKLNQINRWRAQLDALDTKIRELQELYDKAPDPAQKQPDRRTDSGGGGGGGGGGGKGTGGGGRATAPPSTPKTDEHRGNKATLKTQLDQKKAEREGIAKKLVGVGEKVAGFDAGASGGAPAAAATVTLGLLDNPEVKVWTHDMTAEPGAVYRYRVRVVINNPMYGRNLKEAQAGLAANSLVESPWSEWTAECEVLKPDYYFITSADEAQDISPRPSASAEIYKFYYGYYRQATVHVEPGDTLIGDAKLPADLKLADMDKVRAMLKGDAPQGGPGQPPPPPPPPIPGGPGRQVAPIDRGRMPAAPGAGGPEIAAGADWLDKAAPKQLALKVDAVFLDVAKVPTTGVDLAGTARQRAEALLRDAFGTVLVKLPDSEKADPVYKRVDDSAKAGQNQGKLQAKPIEPDKVGPKAPPKAPPPPRNPGGGGGGGGGG
jgi:hypothetical protein